jgi:SM-20-related protein
MASRYFALQQIARGTLHEQPFKWGQLVEIWRNESIANTLAHEFPTDAFNYRERNGGYFYRRTIVPLASRRVDDPETLSDSWRGMCKELASTEFRAAVAELCGTDLSDYPMEAVAFRGGRDTHYLPHVDASLRLGFRLIIYFNARWKEDWGGSLRILDPLDHSTIHHKIPPKVGNATVIVRDGRFNDTWHEVTRLTGAGIATRNTLNVTYYQPGTTRTSQ